MASFAGEEMNRLIENIRYCARVYSFSDPNADWEEKALKGKILRRLVHLAKTDRRVLYDPVFSELIAMISANLFRTLPPVKVPDFDPDEDDSTPELSWPHLQPVYEILWTIINLKRTFLPFQARGRNGGFIKKLIGLFRSHDRRELSYLEKILDEIYIKNPRFRSLIRMEVTHTLLGFINDGQELYGVSELLYTVETIIVNFTLPLSMQEKQFLMRVLIPLHKADSAEAFFVRLTNCTALFVKKDPHLAGPVILRILRLWPRSNTRKERLFIVELQEIMRYIRPEDFKVIHIHIFKQIALSVSSPSCYVAGRALKLFKGSHVRRLVYANNETIMPVMFEALYRARKGHWNEDVVEQAFGVLMMFMGMNGELYEELSASLQPLPEEEEEMRRREPVRRKLEEVKLSYRKKMEEERKKKG